MDLFTLRVQRERLHPNFLHVLEKAALEDRAVLQEWADGFVDRDGKFAIEFQTTFNSSFWELYLFAVLKRLGYRVDLSVSRPDFIAKRGEHAFAMEATVANNSAGSPAEWQGQVGDLIELQDRAPIVQEATIRLCNSISAKHHKYLTEYESLPWVAGQPFVVALAPFEQPLSRVQNTEAIFQTLYSGTAIPYEVVGQDADGTFVLSGGDFVPKLSVEKPSGAELQLGMFRNGRMPEISAVVFSSVATWGKVRALSMDQNPNVYFETLRANNYGPHPTHSIKSRAEYKEHLLDGLNVFHNPDARHPLDWEAFAGPMVTQVIWLPGESEPRIQTEDGILLQRTVITLRTD
jgi:hypothetical protein